MIGSAVATLDAETDLQGGRHGAGSLTATEPPYQAGQSAPGLLWETQINLSLVSATFLCIVVKPNAYEFTHFYLYFHIRDQPFILMLPLR